MIILTLKITHLAFSVIYACMQDKEYGLAGIT